MEQVFVLVVMFVLFIVAGAYFGSKLEKIVIQLHELALLGKAMTNNLEKHEKEKNVMIENHNELSREVLKQRAMISRTRVDVKNLQQAVNLQQYTQGKSIVPTAEVANPLPEE
jgi:uncharacterized protein YoxC